MTPPPPVVDAAFPDTPYWKASTTTVYNAPVGAVPQGVLLQPPKTKSVLEAYIVGLPLGFLGAHHFYLGRPAFGVLYILSFGLLGAGWVIDLLRMPCLVSSVNKANKDKYEQLKSLQQELAQQGQLPQQGQNVAYVPFEPKNLSDAYVMWFPCGLFGFHHFYLRNYGMGFLYLFTVGLLGLGWLVDLFRMPTLVRRANNYSPVESNEYHQCTAHILALSPTGILGGHHYYLDRPAWGILYTLTLGLLGTGWMRDWCRTSFLVKRANSIRLGKTSPNKKYLDDAYMLCIPFGFTGLHHFYLRRYGWGALYFFTLGLLGIGWLVDICRLPCLVKTCNKEMEDASRRLLNTPSTSLTSVVVAGTGNGAAKNPGGTNPNGNQTEGSAVIVSPNQPFFGAPNAPFYPPAAGYGSQGYQSVYPGLANAGPYPTYLGQGAGAAVVMYPPQYSANSDPSAAPLSGPQAQGPPSYEASVDTKK